MLRTGMSPGRGLRFVALVAVVGCLALLATRTSPAFGLPPADKQWSPEEAWRIGWPNLMGPAYTRAVLPSGLKLVESPDQARHLWRSQEPVPASKCQNAAWLAEVARSRDRAPVAGGGASPILVEGRAYLGFYRPGGSAMDEVERYGGMRFNADNANWGYALRVHFEKTGATGVGLIEADDVVLCTDAATGKTLWKRTFAGTGSNYQTRKDAAVNQRPMCYADGRVYSLGSN